MKHIYSASMIKTSWIWTFPKFPADALRAKNPLTLYNQPDIVLS